MAIVFDFVSVAKDGLPEKSITHTPPTHRLLDIRPATAGEIAKFPTAKTAVLVEDLKGNSRVKVTYLSSDTQAALKTAING